MYGKLTDGNLTLWDGKTPIDGIVSNSDDDLAALGYYPIVLSDAPTAPEGKVATQSGWTLDNENIIRVWELVDAPQGEELPTYEELASQVAALEAENAALLFENLTGEAFV